jgi:hypothetical protein
MPGSAASPVPLLEGQPLVSDQFFPFQCSITAVAAPVDVSDTPTAQQFAAAPQETPARLSKDPLS